MRYLLAILFPTARDAILREDVLLAILAPILQLTLIGWIPASLWALFVVNSHLADVRTRKLIEAIERTGRLGK